MAAIEVPKRGVPDDFYYIHWKKEDARREYVDYRSRHGYGTNNESDRLATIYRGKMYDAAMVTSRYENLVSTRRLKNWKRIVYRDWDRYDHLRSSPFVKVRLTNGR